jgi:threonine/homoserine/homoserine lactone efflux protein
MLGLSAVFMLMTFVVFVLYGLLAHLFRRAVIDSPKVQAWLRRGFRLVRRPWHQPGIRPALSAAQSF